MTPEEVARADGYIARLKRERDEARAQLTELYNVRNEELGAWRAFLVIHKLMGAFRRFQKEANQ